MEKSHLSRIYFWSAWLGNLFEHYDTALFGFLSPFLAPLIFPNQDSLMALILTYAMIPLGMVVRPIGSLLFGYLGDFYGRKTALFYSLIGMSVVSTSIAFCPTYEEAGIFSPIFFALSRALQNFFAAGEIVGGGIFLLENSSEKKHDWLSSLYSASTIGGILLASLGVSFLCALDIQYSLWRALYLLGAITGIFGCFIRWHLPNIALAKNVKTDWMQGVWTYWRPFLQIAIAAAFSYATYSIALVMMNGFLPLITTLSKKDVNCLNTFLLVLDFIALPLFGWIALKISREKLMFYAATMTAISAIPLFLLLEIASLQQIIFVRIYMVLLGVAFFAPFYAWAQTLIPLQYRYTLISLAYALGSQLLGSPTSSISLWLFHQTQSAILAGAYWFFLATACSLSFMLVKNKTCTITETDL